MLSSSTVIRLRAAEPENTREFSIDKEMEKGKDSRGVPNLSKLPRLSPERWQYGALSVSKIVRVRHTFIRCHSFAHEVCHKLHEVGSKLHEVDHKLHEVGQELHEVGYKLHAVRHKLHEVCLFGNKFSLILREVGLYVSLSLSAHGRQLLILRII